MKKLFFILAFMLMGSVTFANNSKTESKEKTVVIENVNSDYKEIVEIVLTKDFLCLEYHTVVVNHEIVAEFYIARDSGCVGTIHFLK